MITKNHAMARLRTALKGGVLARVGFTLNFRSLEKPKERTYVQSFPKKFPIIFGIAPVDEASRRDNGSHFQ
jgi:hypothetical protein